MPQDSETTDALLDAGMRRARAYDWDRASTYYRRAVTIAPEQTEPRFRLGWSLWNLAEAEKPSITDIAIAYGAKAFGFAAAAKDGQKRFQKYRQRLQEAESYLRAVIDRDQKHARAWHYLALTLAALDRHSDGAEAAHRAASLDPQNRTYREYASNLAPPTEKPAEQERPAAMTWDDLVLNSRTKRELRQVQLMLEQPDLANDLGVEPPTGILLKGPPGTGKTTIARILATEANCSFFSITPADVQSKYVGESEKSVHALFEKARAHAPSIIFIDEIDALISTRQGGNAIHSDKVVNQFLQEMDGIKPNSRVLVVGATNRPDMLDPAVRRGGRLSREIEIPLPDDESRRSLFMLCTRGIRIDRNVYLDELANKTEGYSGADIRALVNEAGLQALIRLAETEHEKSERTLIQADFDNALENLA